MGILDLLCQFIVNSQDGSSLQRNATWCVVNFLRGKNKAPLAVTNKILPYLTSSLQRTQCFDVIQEVLEGTALFLDEGYEESLKLAYE